jgi:hypothetical protein
MVLNRAWVVALLGVVASSVSAQSVSPFWQSTPLPSRQLDAVAPAVAEATRARWTYIASGAELTEAIELRRREFEASADYRLALDDLTISYRAYSSAVSRALEPLESDLARAASHHLASRLRAMIADEAQSDRPNEQRIEALAAMRMQKLSTLRADERALLERDADVIIARDQFRAAYAELRELRASFELSARRDTELAELRRQKRQARTDHLAAAAERGATLRVAQVALDWSREAQRLESRRNGQVAGHGFRPGYPINWH